MTLLNEASSGRTFVTFKTSVQKGKVSEVPRQTTKVDSFLKGRAEYHSITSIKKEVADNSAL
jgi:hypothetical protein